METAHQDLNRPDAHQVYGLPLDATVSKALTRNGWIFRGARSDNAESLMCYLTGKELKLDVKDVYLWANSNGDPQDRFSFADTWKVCKTPAPEVPWHKQVWFPGSIPKYSFMMWLACLDRMPTMSRLRNWGLVEDDTCILCEIYNETRDHLFLRCPYSYDLWRWCISRMQLHFMGFSTWDRLILWLQAPCSEGNLSTLKLLVAQAVIYTLWHERNARLFTGKRTPVEGLYHLLDRRIRNTCLARDKSPKLRGMLEYWFRGLSN
ncbi:PREDICTED: uncharacterized protein LOC104709930 [Camelina sativa]|uniref:Uncharacterized protein LOC104709930 n=1 Tax=Camelina sativa TaxID=90675 RepID=A0ABM0TDJ3_CAMSA|nr:PREDICTED: uncharacterized protein LOC104709930 [Camelina sativa]